MESLLQDLRHALRQLRKSPGFTLVAVLTLALGIGATTAVYSVANWIFLRPLPGARDDGRLVAVFFTFSRGYRGTSYLDYLDFAERTTVFTGLAGEARGIRTWVATDGLTPRRLRGSWVSDNYFAVLGVNRYLGRFLERGDFKHGAPPVVVLSHHVWREAFEEDRNVVGRIVTINDVPTTIVGVAGPEFAGTERVATTDVWQPVTARSAKLMGGIDTYSRYFEGRANGVFPELIGRLLPGISPAQAQAQLNGVVPRMIADMPAETMGLRGITAEVHRGMGIPVDRRDAVAATVRVLWIGAVAVMLIAVANVTNLLVFRGVGRRAEMAVRRALGASVETLARQALVEGLAISLLGGAGAVAIAAWMVSAFRGLTVSQFVPVGEVQLDGRVLAFGLLLGAMSGVVVGLVPLFVSGGHRFGAVLKEASTAARGAWFRNSLGVLQVATTLTLLVGALLLTGTLRNLRSVDVGFDPAGLHVFGLGVGLVDLEPAVARDIRATTVDRIRALPGVSAVTPTYIPPFGGGFGGCLPTSLDYDDPELPKTCLSNVYVRPDYFSVLGIPLEAGRTLPALGPGSSEDDKNAIVVSRSVARLFFGNADPLGRTISISGFLGFADLYAGRPAFGPARHLRIVGVARDSRWTSIVGREVFGPLVYRNLEQLDGNTPQAHNGTTILVRSSLAAASLKPEVERIARDVAPGLTVSSDMMVDRMEGTLAEQRLFARVIGLLTSIAVTLAAVGLFGLVSFSVVQRTREFGVRIALGADVREILNLVVKQGATVAGTGAVLGLAGAVVLSRVLERRLFGVMPLEPYIYLLAIALLVLLTLGASIIPARAATKVDPMVALRSE